MKKLKFLLLVTSSIIISKLSIAMDNNEMGDPLLQIKSKCQPVESIALISLPLNIIVIVATNLDTLDDIKNLSTTCKRLHTNYKKFIEAKLQSKIQSSIFDCTNPHDLEVFTHPLIQKLLDKERNDSQAESPKILTIKINTSENNTPLIPAVIKALSQNEIFELFDSQDEESMAIKIIREENLDNYDPEKGYANLFKYYDYDLSNNEKIKESFFLLFNHIIFHPEINYLNIVDSLTNKLIESYVTLTPDLNTRINKVYIDISR